MSRAGLEDDRMVADDVDARDERRADLDVGRNCNFPATASEPWPFEMMGIAFAFVVIIVGWPIWRTWTACARWADRRPARRMLGAAPVVGSR